ncbi:hypothetical protein SCA6_015972, partial [Theobroma cacao]
LDIIDIIRAKVVCSSWNSLGEELVPRTPWLMLPSKEVEGGYDVDNNAYSGFLKLGESQVCSLKKMPKEFRESCCIGPLNGWLIFLEEKAVPFLFHPFKQVKIPTSFIICSARFTKNGKKGGWNDVNKLRNDEKIAYHDNEDRYWTEAPDARHPPYQDIICHENQLLALGEGNNIEIWNFQDGFMRNIRFIGEFVESDGKLVSEKDLYAIGIQPKGKSGNNGKNDFGWLANCKKVSFHALTPTFNLGIIKRNRRSRSQNVSLSIKSHTELQGPFRLGASVLRILEDVERWDEMEMSRIILGRQYSVSIFLLIPSLSGLNYLCETFTTWLLYIFLKQKNIGEEMVVNPTTTVFGSFILENQKVYTLKNVPARQFCQGLCIGSSHG